MRENSYQSMLGLIRSPPSPQVATFRGEAYYDPADVDSDSDVFHTGSGTYRFDVDIPECPTKPYRSFFLAVQRTVAPPPPPLPAPPPPYYNAIDVTFSVVFEGVRFSDYQGSLQEIQQRLLLILVSNTAVERCEASPCRPPSFASGYYTATARAHQAPQRP